MAGTAPPHLTPSDCVNEISGRFHRAQDSPAPQAAFSPAEHHAGGGRPLRCAHSACWGPECGSCCSDLSWGNLRIPGLPVGNMGGWGGGLSH